MAAASTFALTMGVRNTMGLYLSSLNTGTGLGITNISLAFAFGQLWWGLTQPFAGAVADRISTGRVIFMGILLIVIGTLITPFMTTALGLILSIGVLVGGGAGMVGPSVLTVASNRLVPVNKRGLATGIVNAGGSFGQFVMAPIATDLTAALGWVAALQGDSQHDDVTTTTLGLRGTTMLDMGEKQAILKAGLGWRHAAGDIEISRRMSFAHGNGASFNVAGAPIAKNAAVVDLGAEVSIGRATALGLSYSGQFGDGNIDNTGPLYLKVRLD